jgi:TadE-like protein
MSRIVAPPSPEPRHIPCSMPVVSPNALTGSHWGVRKECNKIMRRESRQGKGGQALVEFAATAPVAILLLMSILAFGLIFSWQNVLDSAAREGARAGSVCKSDDAIGQTVAKSCAPLPNPGSVSVLIDETDVNGAPLPSGSRQRGGAITVTLTYPASIVGVPGVLPGQRTLTAQSTFRMECDSP